ncbi:MAG: TIGR02996 domain-containing protein [Deltaproteobacteria bacterium]|nr:TIGR02996 domain-containing protein [Deltaproteobacteria bacterium]
MVVVKVRYPDGRTKRLRFDRTFTIGTISNSDVSLEHAGHQVQTAIAIADPDVRLDVRGRSVITLRLNDWHVDPDFVHVLHVGDRLQLADHLIVFELVAGTAEEVRRALGESSRDPDVAEAEILAALRADPTDAMVREVYADWLDGHERCNEAEFVRLQWLPDGKRVTDNEAFSSEWMSHQPQAIRLRLRDLAQLSDPSRRALVSRPTVLCRHTSEPCPRIWDAFALTPVDTTRSCATCKHDVEFCSTLQDVSELGFQAMPVALDPFLVAETARDAYYSLHRDFDEPTNPVFEDDD